MNLEGMQIFATAEVLDGYNGKQTPCQFGLKDGAVYSIYSFGYHKTFLPEVVFKDHNDAFCNGLTKLEMATRATIAKGTLKPNFSAWLQSREGGGPGATHARCERIHQGAFEHVHWTMD